MKDRLDIIVHRSPRRPYTIIDIFINGAWNGSGVCPNDVSCVDIMQTLRKKHNIPLKDTYLHLEDD